MTGEVKEEKLTTARNYFYNDSFWLIAPFKVRDPGTIREYVNFDGKDALLVTYTSGGATPGDSYLWILDENNRPLSWKMWVSIIPFGGMETSWESWEKFHDAWISTLHKGPVDIKIENLSAEK